MNSARLLVINILIFLLLIGGGAAAWYFLNQSQNYLSTDNAKVVGQQITIAATTAGQLTDWTGEVGKTYQAGDRIGTIQAGGGTSAVAAVPSAPSGSPRVDLTLPTSATVVQQNAVKNSFVAPGTPLAYAYDLDHLWVTANIGETNINDVKTGQTVDVYVDAYPGTTLTGKVDSIGLATSGTFSMLPTSNATGNYTKVEQVIPVKISLDGYRGLRLMPGMNATVRIHK